MAGAYTVFANGGIKIDPWLLASVRAPNGDVMNDYTPTTKPILDPRVAYLTTNMMEGVMNFGYGYAVRKLGFMAPAAGKTGTSHDVWFAGYTSNLLCIVWVGNDDYTNMAPLSGANRRRADLGGVHEGRNQTAAILRHARVRPARWSHRRHASTRRPTCSPTPAVRTIPTPPRFSTAPSRPIPATISTATSAASSRSSSAWARRAPCRRYPPAAIQWSCRPRPQRCRNRGRRALDRARARPWPTIRSQRRSAVSSASYLAVKVMTRSAPQQPQPQPNRRRNRSLPLTTVSLTAAHLAAGESATTSLLSIKLRPRSATAGTRGTSTSSALPALVSASG